MDKIYDSLKVLPLKLGLNIPLTICVIHVKRTDFIHPFLFSKRVPTMILDEVTSQVMLAANVRKQ